MKKINNCLWSCVFLSLLWCVKTPVLSAELIAECQDPAYLQEQAGAVIHGTVLYVESKEDENSMIYTLITIKADRYTKGEGPDTIVIKRLGGTIEKNGEIIQAGGSLDDAVFKAGESGYVYLQKPETPFYAGQFYSTVCSLGIMNEEH